MADGTLLPLKAGAAANANANGANGAASSAAPAPSELTARARAAAAELWRRTKLEYACEVRVGEKREERRNLSFRAARVSFALPDLSPLSPLQLPLLRAKWRTLAICACAQYAHGAAAQLAHRLHAPAAAPLRDAGFALFAGAQPPEWASEALFGSLFALFILWSASPFWRPPRSVPFYTVTLYARTLAALTVCQALRCAAFLVTGLPGPAPHCASGAATATRPMPRHWWGHAIVDVARQAGHGCGDLLFSR